MSSLALQDRTVISIVPRKQSGRRTHFGRAVGNSLFRPMNTLFTDKPSLFRLSRELACNALELRVELTSAAAEMAGNQQHSLLFSLLPGNPSIKAPAFVDRLIQ